MGLNRYILLGLLTVILCGSTFSQEGKKIDIRHAGEMVYDQRFGKDVRRFIGDAVFEHNNVVMYCDSAYLFSQENKMFAYSNVHVTRGDTLHMYGDFMIYNGNTNEGKVRRNVLLSDEEIDLTTDSLNFNTETNIAYYYTGGRITSEENVLTSIKGYYYADYNTLYFKDSTVVNTPDYTILTDTLKYNVKTEIVTFLGPSEIFNEENYLFCENGMHEIPMKTFYFSENAYYKSNEKTLRGDSLYFNDSLGIGKAFRNIEMLDTIQNTILKGHYVNYTKEPETALVTDSAVLIQVTDNNDSLFLHADTLFSEVDTLDSLHIMRAYHHVKIFKSDLQGKCDSLTYTFSDSTITLFYDPVIWAEGSQLTADNIKIIVNEDNEVEQFELESSALIVSQEDTGSYNQIAGKVMYGYLVDNEIRKVEVYGNSQSIYFTKDENEIIGMNHSQSTDMVIYLKNNEVDRINMINEPDGTLYPLDEIESRTLQNFIWRDLERPRSKYDIFIWEVEKDKSTEQAESENRPSNQVEDTERLEE